MLKIRAGAIQMAIFISVIVALLLFTFIVLIHTHKKFGADSHFNLETIKNADKGIAFALSNKTVTRDTVFVDLKDQDFKSLKVCHNFWGVFETVSSTATIKSKRFAKIALIGTKQSESDRTALYVKDNKKPLVLVGNTRIQGVAFLPKRGVKTGNISGQSYYGERLIYGSAKASNSFPLLSSEILQNLNAFKTLLNTIASDKILNLNKKRKHQNSFFEPTKYFVSNTDIELSNLQLVGNIMIVSNTKIILNPSSNLKDVILIAPEIEIMSNVSGTFQAIATKEINVGKNCRLNYPSALVLDYNIVSKNPSAVKKENPVVYIKEKTEINGAVVFLGNIKLNDTKTQVILEEGAIIRGEIYCAQNLELKGQVYGTVFTSNFIANQSGSIYQNHIYNGIIIIDQLPEEYAGLNFEDGKKGVLKWLY